MNRSGLPRLVFQCSNGWHLQMGYAMLKYHL